MRQNTMQDVENKNVNQQLENGRLTNGNIGEIDAKQNGWSDTNESRSKNDFNDGRDIRDPKIDQAGDPDIEKPMDTIMDRGDYGTGDSTLDTELGIPHKAEREAIGFQTNDKANDEKTPYATEGKRGPGIKDRQDAYVINGDNIEEVPINERVNGNIYAKDQEDIMKNKGRDAKEIREMIEENPRILYPTI